MPDSFWNNLGGILTAAALILTSIWTLLKVHKVQEQTNSMNEKMVASAKKEGKAEVLETLTAVGPALPVAITPIGNDPKAVEWIKMGIEIEKARKERENGVHEKP